MNASPLKSLLGALVAGTFLVNCGPREGADALAGRAAGLQNAEGAFVATSESIPYLGKISSGTFADTQAADGVAQVLTETAAFYDSTHKKLDHTWTLPAVPAGHYTLRVIAKKSLADFETFSFDWKNATDTYFTYGACTFTGTSYVTCEAPVSSTGGDIEVRVSENWHLEDNFTSISVDYIGLSVRADYTAPTVSITSPVSGSTVSGIVNIDVDATDDVGVTRVDFYRSGLFIGSDTTPPFSFAWDTTAEPNDSTSLSAKAFDATGNVATSALVRPLNVLNAGGVDTQAPTGTITSPEYGIDLSGIVTVTASAQDNIGVARVEFYYDYNTLLGSDTTAPYSLDWDTTTAPNGFHSITVRIYDAAGNFKSVKYDAFVSNAKTNEATLSVTATGRLGPVITSNPTGIYAHANMPGSGTFVLGTQITLKVDSGRTAIWSGACSSGGVKRTSCTFMFNGDASVSANIQ
ncbi:Ig-like domain-containing protein [Archangium lipolyticum]|uniref:Ig-like domain-containing protein n=1 Tax=Archangium lipolyticum TaxID=2970465 RepID=UPI00214B7695|nr:Ig-like domain-containing protein [Archangium lipolyticum]